MPNREHGCYSAKNIQPNCSANLYYIEKPPTCPHYTIIEICAILTGKSKEELEKIEKFCGYERYFGKAGGGGDDNIYCTCETIGKELNALIRLVNSNRPEKPTEELNCDSSADVVEEWSIYVREIERYQDKVEILKKWKNLPPDLNIDPKWSDEKIIARVKLFFETLQKILPMHASRRDDVSCRQSPYS